MKTVGVLVNGPGEMLGWARPVCRDLGRRGYRVHLFILPCQFASGKEKSIASSLHADMIFGPSSAISTMLGFALHKVDLVLQLGGDLIFGRVLSFVSGAPLISYSYSFKKGMKSCASVITGYEKMAESIRKRGISPVTAGDLVLDSLAMNEWDSLWEPDDKLKVLLLPGSRSYSNEQAVEFFSTLLWHIRQAISGIRFKALLPGIASDEELNLWCDSGILPQIGSSAASLAGTDLAICPPGTNNLEMMHAGIPAVIVLPFSFLKMVPLPGLLNIIYRIPCGGARVKEFILRRADRDTGFIGWPNRLAEKEIQREIRGDVTPEMIATEIVEILKDRTLLSKMKEDSLKQSAASRRNTSKTICDIVERLI